MQPITSLIKESFNIYKQNTRTFLLIILLPAILTGIAAFFEPEKDQNVATSIAISYLLFWIFSSIASVMMTIALIHKVADTSLDAQAAYKLGMQQFFKYVLFSIVLSLILIVGLMLLVIPAIWLGVSFSFAMFFLLLENRGIKSSLKSSFELVKGKWWSVFGRTLILGLISIAVVIVIEVVTSLLLVVVGDDITYALSTALMFTLTPFSVAYMYFMFRDIQSKQAPVAEVQSV